MFKVRDKRSNSIYEVYDIQYDNFNDPHFLIYENDRWKKVNAIYYEPCKAHSALNEDYKNKTDGDWC